MESTKHIFTLNEKKCFRDIVKKYHTIIENKDTNGEFLRKKNATWEIITDEFNACPHATIQVTTKQLRRLWMNLKQRSKEKQQRLNNLSNHSSTNGDPLNTDNIGIQHLTSFHYKDFEDESRQIEKHELEMQILKERLREAKAKADLAELILNQQRNVFQTVWSHKINEEILMPTYSISFTINSLIDLEFAKNLEEQGEWQAFYFIGLNCINMLSINPDGAKMQILSANLPQ